MSPATNIWEPWRRGTAARSGPSAWESRPAAAAVWRQSCRASGRRARPYLRPSPGSSSARQHEPERIKNPTKALLGLPLLFFIPAICHTLLCRSARQEAVPAGLAGWGYDCSLLLINHKLWLSVFFSLQWWSGFIIFNKKKTFLLTHTKAMQGLFSFL